MGTHDFIHRYISTDGSQGITLLTLRGTYGKEESQRAEIEANLRPIEVARTN
jgi:hypothetical protein